MFLTIRGLGCVPPKPCLFAVLPEDWYSYMYPSPCVVLGLSSLPGGYGRRVCGDMKEAGRVFSSPPPLGGCAQRTRNKSWEIRKEKVEAKVNRLPELTRKEHQGVTKGLKQANDFPVSQYRNKQPLQREIFKKEDFCSLLLSPSIHCKRKGLSTIYMESSASLSSRSLKCL